VTTQSEKVRTGRAFFAAFDRGWRQHIRKALAEYGIGQDRYSSDAEMFELVHTKLHRALWAEAGAPALTSVPASPAFDGPRSRDFLRADPTIGIDERAAVVDATADQARARAKQHLRAHLTHIGAFHALRSGVDEHTGKEPRR
jgi:DNA-binding GntR family transcriptional regulator